MRFCSSGDSGARGAGEGGGHEAARLIMIRSNADGRRAVRILESSPLPSSQQEICCCKSLRCPPLRRRESPKMGILNAYAQVLVFPPSLPPLFLSPFPSLSRCIHSHPYHCLHLSQATLFTRVFLFSSRSFPLSPFPSTRESSCAPFEGEAHVSLKLGSRQRKDIIQSK